MSVWFEAFSNCNFLVCFFAKHVQILQVTVMQYIFPSFNPIQLIPYFKKVKIRYDNNLIFFQNLQLDPADDFVSRLIFIVIFFVLALIFIKFTSVINFFVTFTYNLERKYAKNCITSFMDDSSFANCRISCFSVSFWKFSSLYLKRKSFSYHFLFFPWANLWQFSIFPLQFAENTANDYYQKNVKKDHKSIKIRNSNFRLKIGFHAKKSGQLYFIWLTPGFFANLLLYDWLLNFLTAHFLYDFLHVL